MPTLRTLNFLIALSAVSAMILDSWESKWFYLFKPLTTILIILVPIIHGDKESKTYLRLTILALIFCLFGDVLLMMENKFVWGLAAFLIGHIFFLFSFISLHKFRFYIVPIIFLGGFGVFYYWYLSDDLGEFALPVLAYVIFIILMSWQGINLYVWKKERAFLYIAIGVVLFMFSDSMIALNKFKIPFEFAGIVILSTYWLGISLLANATSIMKIKG